MPTLCLQVGQCGNQLGDALWQLFDSQRSGLVSTGELYWPLEFWHPSEGPIARPRCIRVDTDDKVLDQYAISTSSTSSPSVRCQPHQLHRLTHTGCGNNWAHGYDLAYSSCAGMQGPNGDAEGSCADVVMEGVRRELEACDVLPDILMACSTSGGTGSGVGSALLECLADTYPAATRGVVAVLPSGAGDVNIASLNSTLALSHMLPCCDALIALDNMQALTCLTGARYSAGPAAGIKPLASSAAAGGGTKRTAGLLEVNSWMAQALLGVLWPSCEAAVLSGSGALQQLVRQPVLCDPVLKVWDMATAAAEEGLAAGPPAIWQDTLRTLQSCMGKYQHTASSSSSTGGSCPAEPIATLALHVVARGMPTLPAPGASARQRAAAAAGGSWWQSLQPTGTQPTVARGSGSSRAGSSASMPGTAPAAALLAADVVSASWQQLRTGGGLEVSVGPSCSWQQCDASSSRDVCSPPAACGCSAAVAASAPVSVSCSAVGLWGLLTRPLASSTPSSRSSSSSSKLAAGTRPSKVAAAAGGLPCGSLSAVAVRSSAGDTCSRLAGVTRELVDAGAFCHWYARYGCSKQRLLEGAEQLQQLGQYYQLQGQR